MSNGNTPGSTVRSGGELLSFSTSAEARAFLDTLLMDPANVRTLRRTLEEEGLIGVSDLGRLGDHEVLDLAATALVTGRFRIAEVPRPRAAVGGYVPTEEPEEEEETAPAGAVETAEHWIEIALVDEDDQPVPDERYRITFPNGTVQEGRLDADGLARFPNLQNEGECTFTFPYLDEEAWEGA